MVHTIVTLKELADIALDTEVGIYGTVTRPRKPPKQVNSKYEKKPYHTCLSLTDESLGNWKSNDSDHIILNVFAFKLDDLPLADAEGDVIYIDGVSKSPYGNGCLAYKANSSAVWVLLQNKQAPTNFETNEYRIKFNDIYISVKDRLLQLRSWVNTKSPSTNDQASTSEAPPASRIPVGCLTRKWQWIPPSTPEKHHTLFYFCSCCNTVKPMCMFKGHLLNRKTQCLVVNRLKTDSAWPTCPLQTCNHNPLSLCHNLKHPFYKESGEKVILYFDKPSLVNSFFDPFDPIKLLDDSHSWSKYLAFQAYASALPHEIAYSVDIIVQVKKIGTVTKYVYRSGSLEKFISTLF